MPNEDIFSGIPSLDDTAGLEQYLTNQTLDTLGAPNVPAALQQTEQPAQQDAQTQQQTQPQPQTEPAAQSTNTPRYTAEDVQRIIEQSRAQDRAQVQQAAQQHAAQAGYTVQQAAIIKQLIDRGVPLDRIQQALNGNSQQNAVMQRLQAVEQYLQRQNYEIEQNAFINKMQDFGNKFGLSEAELVTFGNKAMSMGINLINVNDVESVFRAVYPEQYAIRSQRLAGASAAPIYGGASGTESARSQISRQEDAYVERFLQRSMPNQYGMNTK